MAYISSNDNKLWNADMKMVERLKEFIEFIVNMTAHGSTIPERTPHKVSCDIKDMEQRKTSGEDGILVHFLSMQKLRFLAN